MVKEEITVDLIILGAGLVGLTAANQLAQSGFTVAVIEQKLSNSGVNSHAALAENSFDVRCSAITPRSQKILDSIGVWQKIVENRISAYNRMVVWDASGCGEITFDAAEVAEPHLGHIVENRVMSQALFDAAEENSRVTLLLGCKPLSLEINATQVSLKLADEQSVQAQCIIGADGSHSWLRHWAGIKAKKKSYFQQALVATIQTTCSHQQTAWQRFNLEGPVACLPLSHPLASSIVWTGKEKTIQHLLQCSEPEFCAALSQAFDERLGKVVTVSNRQAFSLEELEAEQYTKEKLVLVGDAAHVIHPLAGQGVNLGLYDIEELSKVLAHAKSQGQEIGHHLVLRRFERARKGHTRLMMQSMSFLNQLFLSQNSLLLAARSLSLNFLNNAKILKRKLILEAMG